MTDPDVFVIFKEGDSHGTADGTMLTADVDERMARHRKVGRCVRYVPAESLETEQDRLRGLYHDESITLRRALLACVVDEDNPDTCGVCKHHFAECEAYVRVGDETTEKACPGARARELLRPSSKQTTQTKE